MAQAALFGLGAAALGSVIFYGVTALTGYEIGLIGVLVGYLVGKAVRKGSGSIGGVQYQVLAVGLTYLSITSTYVLGILRYAHSADNLFEVVRGRSHRSGAGRPPERSRHHYYWHRAVAGVEDEPARGREVHRSVRGRRMTTPTILSRCAECNTEIAPGLLSCPSCARLVYSEKLTELARVAQNEESAGRFTEALTAWREALQYLPPGTRQRETVQARVTALSGRLDAAPRQPWWRRASSLGPVGVLAGLLGKAKFLLLGFTKLGTLLSFAASLAVYWASWGWRFAACFLLSIYVHEMGHVAALHRYGIPASAPTFIPGFGALVR